MALNDAAADAALDVYVAGLDPAASNPEATKAGMRGLFRAIFAGIAANAVVSPGTMAAGGDAVVGAGTLS